MNEISKSINDNLQTCCICLEEQTEFDIENDNRLIEYNHCGSYYVHHKCLNIWKSEECLICRKKFYENESNNESNDENNIENNNESDNDIITILIDQNDISLHIKKFCVNFCVILNFIGIGLYFFYWNWVIFSY